MMSFIILILIVISYGSLSHQVPSKMSYPSVSYCWPYAVSCDKHEMAQVKSSNAKQHRTAEKRWKVSENTPKDQWARKHDCTGNQTRNPPALQWHKWNPARCLSKWELLELGFPNVSKHLHHLQRKHRPIPNRQHHNVFRQTNSRRWCPKHRMAHELRPESSKVNLECFVPTM